MVQKSRRSLRNRLDLDRDVPLRVIRLNVLSAVPRAEAVYHLGDPRGLGDRRGPPGFVGPLGGEADDWCLEQVLVPLAAGPVDRQQVQDLTVADEPHRPGALTAR